MPQPQVTRKNIIQYCQTKCPRAKDGCAVDCKLRKRLKVPPHGSMYP